MSRLSNDIRERMARALVMHKFADRAAELQRESVALFHDALDAAYDGATRKLMAQLQKRHGDAFPAVDEVTVNVRGMEITVGAVRFGDRGCFFTSEAEKRPVFNGHTGWRSPILSLLDGDLAERIANLGEARRKITEDIREAYRKALGTLSQFSTGKKLASEWPEAMPVIGSLIPEDNRQLPVIQLAALNDEFDLPPALAKAA